jgi:DNA invertase Pin-like site-specific DNA recombinase
MAISITVTISGYPRVVKVATYLRVSTANQAEEGLGLDVQASAIRVWAKEHGHRIGATYADEGVSGAKELDDRPALAEALAAIKDGSVTGIVVYRLDRLARDLILQEQLLGEVRRLGGQVFTTSAGEAGYLEDDPTDPSRKLIRQVLGAVPEYERSLIALRLQSGRRHKAASGGYAYGAPPFGKKAVDGVLVDSDEERLVLMEMKVQRDQGASYRQIAANLAEMGHKPKRGESWHPQTIARCLNRLG